MTRGVLATKTTKAMKSSGVAWLGDIPDGWEICRLKNVVAIYNGNSIPDSEKIKYEDPINAYPYISSKDIDATFSTANYENGMFTKKEDVLFKIAKAGSVLMCIEGGSAGRKKVLLKKDVSFVNKLACFAPMSIDGRYLFYFLLSPNFEEHFSQNLTGLIGGVSVSSLRNMPILVPNGSEQEAISVYLDEKCGAIDAAIAEAKKGIEEYKAWKISLIDDVVCNGIVRHKCRKETGEVWLEDIPGEWDFKQIRYLFALRDERNDKPLKDVNLISLYTDKGVVQHADLEKTSGNKASTADGYKLVYENDIVVNIILCWMGAVGRSAYNGVTSPAYDVYRPIDPTKVLSRYYHYLFRTPRFNGKCYEEGRGIMMMRWRTYSSEFRAIKVPVPPFEEQQAIADYLDEKCAAIDAMVTEKESLIADLEAYKKSLIYETVTGKRRMP